MSVDFEGRNDVEVTEIVKARKQHKCRACGETIPAGHRYERHSSLFDGQWYSCKRCLRCVAIFEHLQSRETGWDCGPDWELNCGHTYEEMHGEPPPEEIARLAFVTAEEMQRRLTDELASQASSVLTHDPCAPTTGDAP